MLQLHHMVIGIVTIGATRGFIHIPSLPLSPYVSDKDN